MATMFGTKIVTVPTASLITGQKIVATAAVDVQLTADSTALSHGVFVSVLAADDIIYVGLEGVSQTTGLAVHAGDNVFIPCTNASLLWVCAAANGDAATFMAV